MTFFPFAEKNKQGWPWSKEMAVFPMAMSNGKAWPRITIITPSYNQGEYIEETIRSVLLQGYPNLEYIIMDGGSTDQTIAIIKKYALWITYWESKSDRGQSHAINKGFKRATGDLIVWINSDDLLLPTALYDAGLAYDFSAPAVILGDVWNFFMDGEQDVLVKQSQVNFRNFIGIPTPDFSWQQQGTFIPRDLLESLDESLYYAFDWDWMCKILQKESKVCYLNRPVARFRIYDESKTGGNMPSCWEETIQVIQRYKEYLTAEENRHILSFYSLRLAGLYFSSHPNTEKYWNRLQGIKMLFKAMWYHLAIIRERQFWKLFVRALLPKIFYRSK